MAKMKTRKYIKADSISLQKVRDARPQGPPRLHHRRALRERGQPEVSTQTLFPDNARAAKSDCQSRRYHLENPYWQTFDKYVIPLLAKDMDLRRLNELDASKEVRVEKDAGLWEEVKKHQTY